MKPVDFNETRFFILTPPLLIDISRNLDKKSEDALLRIRKQKEQKKLLS